MCFWIAARWQAWRETVIAERVRQEVGALVYLPKVRHVLGKTGKPALGPLYMTYF